MIHFQFVSIECTAATCLNGKCELVAGVPTCTCEAGFGLEGIACIGKYIFLCVQRKKLEEDFTTMT